MSNPEFLGNSAALNRAIESVAEAMEPLQYIDDEEIDFASWEALQVLSFCYDLLAACRMATQDPTNWIDTPEELKDGPDSPEKTYRWGHGLSPVQRFARAMVTGEEKPCIREMLLMYMNPGMVRELSEDAGVRLATLYNFKNKGTDIVTENADRILNAIKALYPGKDVI